MTKSQPSGSRLRLSSLFHWLVILCFIKLAVLGLLMLDVPLPSFLGGENQTGQQVRQKIDPAPATAKTAPIHQQQAPDSSQASAEHAEPDATLPQGAAAARLAASIQPTGGTQPTAEMPVPAITDPAPAPQFQPGSELNADAALTTPPDLPLPAPLPTPVAEPGSSALITTEPRRGDNPNEEGLLDALGLKNLPIPLLGAASATAASLDMPVPQTETKSSPFAPVEQNAPLTVPGAPDIPANIPRGQGSDGTPLPARGAAASPQQATPGASMPAPNTMRDPSLPAPSTAGTGSGFEVNTPNANAQELARQQQDALMLKRQMDARLEELRASEQKVKDMLREAKGLEDAKMKSLILMYGNMKPKTAARALESMDERVAIQILKGLTPKQSGEILSYTNPATTAKLTELLTRMRLPQ